MWHCYECGADFDDPVVKTEQRAGEPSFDIDACPICGGDRIVDTNDYYNCEE